MKTTKTLAAPLGMSGLYVEPWTKGEIYAVAANWAQAGSPVLVYGEDGWTHDEHGRQVADFRHRTRAALESIIREAIEMGGDEPDDEEVSGILDNADELRSFEIGEMADMLNGHGDQFSGNYVDDEAQNWLDNDFDADAANEWCEIGVWDAEVAATFRGENLTPKQVAAAAQKLIDAENAEWDAIDEAEAEDNDDWTPCERNSQYTDDPIYSVCNGDTDAQEIIDAAKE
jgi:hypothetical protein